MEITADKLYDVLQRLPNPNTTRHKYVHIAPRQSLRDTDPNKSVPEMSDIDFIRFHKVTKASGHGRWTEWALEIETN